MTAAPEVVLYGKSECGPCFEAERAVKLACASRGIEWRFVNVDTDPAPAGYAEAVPVLHIAGREVARGRITQNRVADALEDALSTTT